MAVNVDELRALPPAEKMRLVEILWDDLGSTTEPIPLPSWMEQEVAKRRDEMLRDPNFGATHEEIWRRIERRNG